MCVVMTVYISDLLDLFISCCYYVASLFLSVYSGMLTALSGGMPRASFGDRHTVGIIEGDNHVVADLSSAVVDFLVLSRGDEKGAVDTGMLFCLCGQH